MRLNEQTLRVTRDRSAPIVLLLTVTAAAVSLATFAGAAEPTFTDWTSEAGVACDQTPASNFVLAPMNVSPMIGGGAVGDFDRDGLQDLIVVSGGAEPDRLFMNNGDGTFTDRAVEAGIASRHLGVGAAVGDVDGDGWLDIFMTSHGTAESGQPPQPGHHRLWRNNGDGTFTNIAEKSGVAFSNPTVADGWGPAFGDYDLDGDLDLYVPQWLGPGNCLFRNRGDGTFENVTVAAGVHDTGVRGFSATFVDMNGDRYPELLVAADFGTSRYYINDGDGTFTDFTAGSGTGLDGNGMGHTVADLDRDGRLDWYVTSIDTDHPMPDVPGTGNMQYRNLGDHVFEEVSEATGTKDGGWGWGTVAVDIDHDGLVDLIETNGFHLPNGIGQLEWTNEPSYVFRARPDGTFEEIALACDFDHRDMGRALVHFDLENDGDQDAVVLVNDGPITLFRNDLPASSDAHWIRLFLDTTGNPRLSPDGYGSQVTVRTGSDVRRSHLSGGSPYLGQSELSVHFGLGTATVIDELRVEWSDGTVTRLTDVAANRTLTIESGNRNDIDLDGMVGSSDLALLVASWGDDDAAADLDASGEVDVRDLLILLRNWS